jgi:ATP-dependent Lon protease
MQQLLRHVSSGGHGFALPPIILAGPPGIGKSHYARRLAELAGLPTRMIDVGGGSAGFRISGTEKGWGTEQSGIPVETVLATKVANPLMIVDEVDKAGTAFSTRGTSSSLTTSLLQMLEPTTAQHFECPYHRIPFNMSRVNWIMTANDVDRIPPPLRDRSRLFILPKISVPDATAHFNRLTAGCDAEVEQHHCRVFIAEMCARPEGLSLRQIEQLANALNAPPAPLYQ